MINLNVKSNYSLLSSLLKIDDIINYSISLNNDICVLCDNNMYGVMEFYKKCKEKNIKPVIGLEVNVENYKVYLYCKNYTGYKNMIKLCTIQNERKPVTSDLEKYNSDLICIISFSDKDHFEELNSIFENLYLGYSNKQEEMKATLITSNIVFFKECLYLKNGDSKYLNYLYLIRDGKTISDNISYNVLGKELDFDNIYTLTDNDGVVNADRIALECNLEFPKSKLLLPIYKEENANKYLFELSKAGLKRRLGGEIPRKYQERLSYELSIIDNMGFCNYFLVVYDFIKFAKNKGILVGPGRGSAAGSLVSYSLGITEIDPLQYDLLFERFLNPERHGMPDIDTDFPDEEREEVIEYVRNKYGSKHVSGIVTFGTLSAKQVLRDVARCLNIPTYKLDSLNKLIPNFTKDKLIDIYRNNINFKTMIDSDTTLRNLFSIATKLEGFPRHISSHAAGILMSEKPLDETIPLTMNDSMYLSGYSMEYLEEFGLLKMDFLGLKNLSIIEHILKDIEKSTKEVINFNKIPLDDKKVLHIFEVADTVGIFQFESTGMKNFLRRLRPSTFEDIFAAIALFRPGPAVNIDTYIRRKHGEEEVTYLDKSLEPILKNTYGIFIYQEQIMQAASAYAGYSLGEADILRRAMSKKKIDLLQKEKEKFINKSLQKGHDKKTSDKIFDLILNFAGYGFNRSHSVAYSIIAYKLAYFKVYYKEIFYSNLLTNAIGSETKTKEYIIEARTKNLIVELPDINISDIKYIVKDNKIYFPFTNIKSVGMVAGNKIIEARKKEAFTDIYDTFSKLIIEGVSKSNLEALIYSQAFSKMGFNRKTLIYNLDELINYAELTKDLDPSLVMKPEIEIQDEFKQEYLLQKEKEIFGFYLTAHPTTKYKANRTDIIDLKNINTYFDKKIKTIILVEKIKNIKTNKGENMAFFTGSDETAQLDYVCFPKVYNLYNDIERGEIIEVFGHVEKRLNEFQIIINEIKKMN
ncbi:MAG: DNA polymerase III subunit alpha [Bacilli bacterium]|nr:DNA polymerase III subunit alpha [Bacilli bacterium]